MCISHWAIMARHLIRVLCRRSITPLTHGHCQLHGHSDKSTKRNSFFGQLLLPESSWCHQLGQFCGPMSQGMQWLLLKFGRDAERQSDNIMCQTILSKSGIGVLKWRGIFLKTLERQQKKFPEWRKYQISFYTPYLRIER